MQRQRMRGAWNHVRMGGSVCFVVLLVKTVGLLSHGAPHGHEAPFDPRLGADPHDSSGAHPAERGGLAANPEEQAWWNTWTSFLEGGDPGKEDALAEGLDGPDVGTETETETTEVRAGPGSEADALEGNSNTEGGHENISQEQEPKQEQKPEADIVEGGPPGLAEKLEYDQEQRYLCFVVPLRDRALQADIFRYYLRGKLGSTRYILVFVEQTHEIPLFNRGFLLNMGYLFLSSEYDNCIRFIFHDVDMLLESAVDYKVAALASKVSHLATKASQFNYAMPYDGYLSGILSMTPDVFEKVNGYSNKFFGWGGEDDDLARRLQAHAPGALQRLHRPPEGRVLSLQDGHTQRVSSHELRQGMIHMLANATLDPEDGLSFLRRQPLAAFVANVTRADAATWRVAASTGALHLLEAAARATREHARSHVISAQLAGHKVRSAATTDFQEEWQSRVADELRAEEDDLRRRRHAAPPVPPPARSRPARLW